MTLGRERVRGWWPYPADRTGDRVLEVCDERDWLNQVHVGRRRLVEGWLKISKEAA